MSPFFQTLHYEGVELGQATGRMITEAFGPIVAFGSGDLGENHEPAIVVIMAAIADVAIAHSEAGVEGAHALHLGTNERIGFADRHRGFSLASNDPFFCELGELTDRGIDGEIARLFDVSDIGTGKEWPDRIVNFAGISTPAGCRALD